MKVIPVFIRCRVIRKRQQSFCLLFFSETLIYALLHNIRCFICIDMLVKLEHTLVSCSSNTLIIYCDCKLTPVFDEGHTYSASTIALRLGAGGQCYQRNDWTKRYKISNPWCQRAQRRAGQLLYDCVMSIGRRVDYHQGQVLLDCCLIFKNTSTEHELNAETQLEHLAIVYKGRCIYII